MKMREGKQFDLFEGRKLRDEGMALAADSKAQILLVAKQIANRLARASANGTCDIDQVQAEMIKLDLDLGMAAGSVFKGKDWAYFGLKPTARKTSHARKIVIWKWVGVEVKR